MEEDPDRPCLDLVESEATVLFLDIGGDTKMSEAMHPDKVGFLVERYFSAFIDDIYANHGDINETAGDGLMVIFRTDSPDDHARSAVRAASAIREKTRRINRELAGSSPPIKVNMGIDTGAVSLGSRRIQGITGSRWTYTASGMVTNISARLSNHAVKGQILLGAETANRLDHTLPTTFIGEIQFKNESRKLPVTELLDQEAGGGDNGGA